jgi:hypothetical protein
MYMIKYRLTCDSEHEFDGWFPHSREFTRQQKAGLLTCPMCDSKNVDKALMSPGISKNRRVNVNKLEKMRQETLSSDQMMPASQAKNVLNRIGKYITKNFENVGDRFYDEAVKCEEGDRDDRFYGTPSKEQTDKLLEQGIDLFHVPKIKEN